MTALLLIGTIAASPTVILEAPAEPGLLERVLGQLGDLPYAVEVAARTSTTGSTEERARRLASTKGAAAVILIDAPPAGGCTVTVSHLPSGRLLSRRIDPVGEGRGSLRTRSATWETCALIARSNLQAMSAWRSREVAPPPPREDPPPAEPAPAPLRPAERPALGLEAAVGWRASTDGEGPFGPHGPEARIALRGSGWAAGIELAADLPERLEDGVARIELMRYRAAAAGALDVASFGPFRLSLSLSLGAAFYRRSTFALGEAVVITPPRTTVAFAARGETRISYDLGANIGLELAVGVDALAGAPAIAYAQGDRVLERARPWPVQPQARLGLVFRSGP